MTNEWDDPIEATKMVWNDHEYDSKLEVAWAKTLELNNFEWQPHPGDIPVQDTVWQPDFRVGDVMVEVKPWAGESVDRLWKPFKVHELTGLPVLILRPGIVPQDPNIEVAGCEWESCDGREWIAVKRDRHSWFEAKDDYKFVDGDVCYYSASVVLLNQELSGLVMLHWSEFLG